MLGHYLLTLTTEQEDRVLTEQCLPYTRTMQQRCLVDVVRGTGAGATQGYVGTADVRRPRWQVCALAVVGGRFDDLCERFGVVPVTAAIRARILDNRARRVLTQPSLVGCMDPENT